MIKLPKNQQGLTFISLMLVLGLIVFFVLLTLKIAPIYLDHSKVTNALKGVQQEPGIQNKSEYEIRQMLEKRFDLNYVKDITKDDIKVIKRPNYVKVQIQYETVVKLVGNLSALAEFDDAFEAGQE
ncbi:MAG: DUF4845 domain-containing protein [Methylomonas sp.]|nr:MAG: DUF4845 domain-containing protein [Methylobacter sp.]PPD35449.1 MAG: DUF4845 domain-containing protein [Methylomonas sp.]